MDGLGKKYLIFQLWYEMVQIKYFLYIDIYVFVIKYNWKSMSIKTQLLIQVLV